MALVVGSISGSASAASSSVPSIATSPSFSLPGLSEDLDPLVGGTTTVIFSSPFRFLLELIEDVGAPAVSSSISTSSEPFTPFSVDLEPLTCDLSSSPMPASDAPLAAPFFAGAAFALLAAARVVGAALSLAPEL